MIYRRPVVLCESALAFVDDYESLLVRKGFPPFLIDQAALIIIETLYIKLAYGQFQNFPKYIGLDITRPGFSLYSFDEDFISGKYRSDPHEVHVLSLTLKDLDLLVAGLGTLDAHDRVA